MADSPFAKENRAGVPVGYADKICDRWITSQVFVGKKKNQRIYYALQDSNWYYDQRGGTRLVSTAGGRYYDDKRSRYDENWCFWQIGAYSSNVGSDNLLGRQIVSESCDLRALLQELAALEKRLKDEGYTPVPGLGGNYKDVAAQHGWYFDDHGTLQESNKAALTTGAALSRGQLGNLYAKAVQKKEPAFVSTWDDFHREMTDKVDISAFADPEKIEEWFVDCCKRAFSDIAALDKAVADDTLPLRERELAVNGVYCHGARYEADPALDYHYFIMRLTALVRAGQKVYAAFMESPMSETHLHMLEYVRDAVLRMDKERFGITSDMVAQVSNLMTQGPDPRGDRPYPLQEVISRRHPLQEQPKPPTP